MGEGERWQRAWRRRSQESADGHRSENRETRPSSVTHEVWYSATARRTSNSAAAVHTFQGRKIMKREREREERDSRKGVQQSSESASLCLQHAHWRQHSRTYSANRAEYYAREGGERRQKRERERGEWKREGEKGMRLRAKGTPHVRTVPREAHFLCQWKQRRRGNAVHSACGTSEQKAALLWSRWNGEKKRGRERGGRRGKSLFSSLSSSSSFSLSPFLPFSLSLRCGRKSLYRRDSDI